MDQEDKKRLYEGEVFKYLMAHQRERIMEILKELVPNKPYSIVVSYVDYAQECPMGIIALMEYPELVLSAADKAACRSVCATFNSTKDKLGLSIKLKIYFRLHANSFPQHSQFYRKTFPGVTAKGTFLCLVGTVTRVGAKKVLTSKKVFQCNKCNGTIEVEGIPSRGYCFPDKTDVKCPANCVGSKMEDACERNQSAIDPGRLDANRLKRDFQQIKMQEDFSSMDIASVNQTFTVDLLDDLVDSCNPGDNVIISGFIFLKWNKLKKGQEYGIERCFKPNHVFVRNEDRGNVTNNPKAIVAIKEFWKKHACNQYLARNLIVKSFCPEIYGLYVVKLAMCVILAGGVGKEKDGTRVRGDSHLLLVGDPGLGKSQLLVYASRLLPRGIMTNGIGVSGAGLTVGATRDESGNWEFAAGALPLANNGICCIDEFSKMSSNDMSSIHEALEQQTISVAKAGMVCNVKTKCTVIAATNPTKPSDCFTNTHDYGTNIPSPILSRFDLILQLNDIGDRLLDDRVGNFILSVQGRRNPTGVWEVHMLQNYFALIRGKNVVISENVERILEAYYIKIRQLSETNDAKVTPRVAEALFRLAEGHAKLMFREKVVVYDAITAIALMEASIKPYGMIEIPELTKIDYPTDPFQEYYDQAELVLTALGLEDIWEKEQNVLNSTKKKMDQESSKKNLNEMYQQPVEPTNTELQRKVYNFDDEWFSTMNSRDLND